MQLIPLCDSHFVTGIGLKLLSEQIEEWNCGSLKNGKPTHGFAHISHLV